jgi:hypothetical protein
MRVFLPRSGRQAGAGASRRTVLTAATGFAATGIVAGTLLPRAPARAARVFDLTGYRQTFAAEFNDPAAPLAVSAGGPFTTRFEQWGALRTLPGTGERELFVDPDFVPSPTGTDAVGHNDAPRGQGQPSAKPLGYNPFSVHDGVLDITAIPTPAALQSRVDRPYLSGMLSTEWSFTQRFGYFEIRTQLPPGRGLWPAFWMVSKTAAEHAEIDVFEAVGGQTSVFHSIHMSAYPKPLLHTRSNAPPGFDYSAGMHVYGVSWTPEEVVFFIDGQESARADGAPLRNVAPMYMIASMAVGGTWPGNPTAGTHFPAVMRIDYIRAYQKAGAA